MSTPEARSLLRQAGRALPVILIVLALGAIAFLFLGDTLGLTGGSDTETADETDIEDDMSADADTEDNLTGSGEGVSLASLYGDGDLGAVQVRLLWVAGSIPVVGQEIALSNRRGLEAGRVKTDNRGIAVFAKVLPGRGYSLAIEKTEGSPGAAFKPVLIRGVTVPKAATKNVDDIYLGENVVLRGRVVDIDGKPLPASSVSVFDGREPVQTDGIMFRMVNMALNLPSPVEQAQTGSDGYFTMTSLKDGVYRLTARRGGYASQHEKDVVVQSDRGAGTLTLVLGEGASLEGTVKRPDGTPIANARVMAIQETGRWMAMETPQREYTRTDENGRYVLDTLQAKSQYRFGVLAKGHMPLFDTGATEVEGKVKRDFVLPVGGTLTGVVVDKDTQKPIADASVAVYVGTFNFRRRNDGAQAASTILRTDKEGRFRISGVNPGPISSAQVKAVGYVTASFSQWTQNQWSDVKEDETTEVSVELERGGIVKGLVLDENTKAPVIGATVILDGGGWGGMMQGLPSTVTDANGQYMLQGVRAGEYTVVASADGFAPGRAEDAKVTMAASGGDHTVDVKLTQAGVVRGVIKDVDGEIVSGVRVRVERRAEPGADNQQGRGRGRGRGGRGSMTMRMLQNTRAVIDMTGSDGKFELRGVGTGRWVVVAESDEYVRSYSQPFRIGAGEVEEADVTMVSGAVLSGRVIDENGGGIKGAVVRVGRLRDEDVRRVNLSSWRVDRQLEATRYQTDSQGRFKIENLEPGTIIVKVEMNDYITWYRRDIRVQAGGVHDGYTVALSKGETIEGTVRGADGKPISGAYVAVTKRENPRQGNDEMVAEGDEAPTTIEPNMGAQTDAQGRYKIENVPAEGRHSVVVWWATGHQSYRQNENKEAIRQGVRAPARDVDFKLLKSEAGAGRGGR